MIGGSPEAIAFAWWEYRYTAKYEWVLGAYVPPLGDRLAEFDRRRQSIAGKLK